MVSVFCAAGVAFAIFKIADLLPHAVTALLETHEPNAIWYFPLAIAGRA